MGKYRNTDIIRAIALLLVLIYHSWVLSGSSGIVFSPLRLVVSLGGEIGVTVFFVLSGFGIYCSLDKKEQTYLTFLKRRFWRIAPEYYVFFIFILLFTPSAAYLSRSGIKDIVLHLFFIHNIIPKSAGSINGVLWTMAVTIQFYVIAIPLYKFVKKHPFLTVLTSILFNVFVKYICFHYLIMEYYVDQPFWYSRNIFISVVDNFVIGMFVAYLCKNKSIEKSSYCIIGLLSSILYVFIVMYLGVKYGIHTDNMSGYLWHSLIAVGIGGIIYSYNMIKISDSNIVTRVLLFLSRYEYGIYIVHLVMMLNLLNNSEIIKMIQEKSIFCVCLVLIFLAIISGIIYNICIDLLRKEISLKIDK